MSEFVHAPDAVREAVGSEVVDAAIQRQSTLSAERRTLADLGENKLYREIEAERECLGRPARYWYDAFQIAEGLRADAERRVTELKSARSSASYTKESLAERIERYFARVRKLGGDTGEADASFLAQWILDGCALSASEWNMALEKALLAVEAEQAKYREESLAAKAVRGALEYAMFAIRGLKRNAADSRGDHG